MAVKAEARSLATVPSRRLSVASGILALSLAVTGCSASPRITEAHPSEVPQLAPEVVPPEVVPAECELELLGDIILSEEEQQGVLRNEIPVKVHALEPEEMDMIIIGTSFQHQSSPNLIAEDELIADTILASFPVQNPGLIKIGQLAVDLPADQLGIRTFAFADDCGLPLEPHSIDTVV